MPKINHKKRLKALNAEPISNCDNKAMLTHLSIMTNVGAKAIETVRQNDMILTMHHGYQPIRWIGAKLIVAKTLKNENRVKFIKVKKGSLGNNIPNRDLIIAQEHRVLLPCNHRPSFNNKGVNISNHTSFLTAVKNLLCHDGVDIAYDIEMMVYYHMIFDQDEIIFINDTPVECIFTDTKALASINADERKEILALFPELLHINYKTLAQKNSSFRPFPKH